MTRHLPLIGASAFSLFHIVTVVLTLLVSHGGGEGQAFLVAILDFPLVLLLRLLPGGDFVLYGSSTAYVGFFSVAGTLLYAAAGYGVGLLLRALIVFLGRRIIDTPYPRG